MKNSGIFNELFILAILLFGIQLLNAQNPKNMSEVDKDFLKKNNNTQAKNTSIKYKKNADDNKLTSFCDDGGFENSATLNWANWHGYYGKSTSNTNRGFEGGIISSDLSGVGWVTGVNWVSGLIQSGNTSYEYQNWGSISGPCPPAASGTPSTDLQIHHQIQISGNDPILGSLVPKVHSGNHAVKLGNAGVNNGVEKLEKYFVVTTSTQSLGFYYAVVMGNPTTSGTGGHHLDKIPTFMIQIRDESNVLNPYHLNGLINLGNGSNFVTNLDALLIKTISYTDPCNPNVSPNEEIAYKPWSYLEINLPNTLIGKTIAIEFITIDCGHTGHFCYAYMDDFCSEPTYGDVSGYSALGLSDSCGLNGKICIDYSLPKSGTTTGTVKFSLNTITGGGTVMNAPISSPVLTSGNSYCFNVSSLGAISPISFDYYITADYTLSSATLPQQIIESTVSGVKLGLNNDYKTKCGPDIVFDPCCPPMNVEMMKSVFKVVPTGTITDPYKYTFTPTAQFKSTSQAYCDYIKTLYPSINRLTYEWNLFKAGTGNQPVVSYQAADRLEQYYNWFVPQGNGTIQSQTNFFNSLLEVNKWYRVYVGVFTEPASSAFNATECSGRNSYFIRIQFQNGMRKAQISDGRNIVSEMIIDPNNKKN